MIRYLFELLPVITGLFAAVACAYRYGHERRRQNRLVMLLGVVSSVLLVVAQTSWWTSFAVMGLGEGTQFADLLWTIFNNLTMLTFIVASHAPKK